MLLSSGLRRSDVRHSPAKCIPKRGLPKVESHRSGEDDSRIDGDKHGAGPESCLGKVFGGQHAIHDCRFVIRELGKEINHCAIHAVSQKGMGSSN